MQGSRRVAIAFIYSLYW